MSNFGAALLRELLADATLAVPAVNQCSHAVGSHNATHMPAQGGDDATAAFCKEKGILYSAYSPMGGLSGTDVFNMPEVIAIGKAHNVSGSQVALRWLVQQGIAVVTAAHNPAYIAQDRDVFGFELTAAEMATLAALTS